MFVEVKFRWDVLFMDIGIVHGLVKWKFKGIFGELTELWICVKIEYSKSFMLSHHSPQLKWSFWVAPDIQTPHLVTFMGFFATDNWIEMVIDLDFKWWFFVGFWWIQWDFNGIFYWIVRVVEWDSHGNSIRKHCDFFLWIYQGGAGCYNNSWDLRSNGNGMHSWYRWFVLRSMGIWYGTGMIGWLVHVIERVGKQP